MQNDQEVSPTGRDFVSQEYGSSRLQMLIENNPESGRGGNLCKEINASRHK